MASTHGTNQGPIVTQRYLNTAAWAGDPTPGALVSTAQVSGSIIQSYAGMVGGILTLDEDDANYYRDPASAQLYAGDFQYVEFYSGSTLATEQGQIMFWKTVLGGQYIVTPDYWLSGSCNFAGIALCRTGRGKFWFIQTGGIAQVLFRHVPTKATPAVCDLVYVGAAGNPSRHADVIDDATVLVSPQLKLVLGKAWAVAPVANTISPVVLTGISYYPGA